MLLLAEPGRGQPADDVPPTSAGRGGGSGTAELGCAADDLGAEDVALAEPDVDGDAEVLAVALPEVLDFDVVVPDVDVPDVDVEDAGDCGPW